MTARFQPQRPFIIPVFLPHAGCPHRCVFCNQHAITGDRTAPTTPERVAGIVRHFSAFKGQRRSSSQIAFYGGNFLGLPPTTLDTLLQAADRQIDAGLVDSIRFSTRPDTVDRRRMELLAPFPVDTVELGVQSMDDRVLSRSRRGHTSQASETAVYRLKQRGYKVGIQLMTGLPGQTMDSLQETAHRVAGLSPSFVRIYPTLVLKHSVLAHWFDRGRYIPLSLPRAVEEAGYLYLFFFQHGIPVIRMGLQASDGLDSGAAITAGPYHPAFGHLVHCRIFFMLARRLLESVPVSAKTVTLKVHPRSLSRLQGPNRVHLNDLKKEFGLARVDIRVDSQMPVDAVSQDGPCRPVAYSDLALETWNPVESNAQGDEARCD